MKTKELKIKNTYESIFKEEKNYTDVEKDISKLKRNIDFIEIPTKDKYIKVYIPLNYKTSMFLASDKVGNCKGKWKLANSPKHWDEYIIEDHGIVTYIINYAKDVSSEKCKEAIYFFDDEITIERTNSFDKNIDKVFYDELIKNYMEKNWFKLNKKFKRD